jgi:hypothetical protein
MRRVRFLALVAISVASAIAAADTYTFTDMPQSVQNYQVFPGAINDSGDLLLNGNGPRDNAIFVLEGQKVRLVQTGPSSLQGTALTNNGTVGGSVGGPNGNVLFTIGKDGKVTNLPLPRVSAAAILAGLNERGDYLVNTGLFGNANFIGRKDSLNPILIPGYTTVYATGLSEDDTVAGFVQNGSPSNPSIDFLMHDQKVTFFTVPFAQAAWPTCLSRNARFVAGEAAIGGANLHGFVREKNGTLSGLAYPFPATRVVNGSTETLRFAQTGITGVNSQGQVCGRAIAIYDGAFVDSSIVGFVARPDKRP